MGFLDRLLRSGAADDDVVVRHDAGMEFRAGILREARDREERRKATELPRRVNSTWMWTGDRWQKWSTVWKTYDEIDQTDVPTPLLDLLGEHGITPTAGDRFRWIDDEWKALDPGESDQLPTDDDPDEA
ncbi:hypothetical protein [Actinospongicola halichondriae]|uniref:hypothetical protein n=1 Tax=Actinospongicola halichondriae TaxID=3236844 RepID=UPI003D3FD19A